MQWDERRIRHKIRRSQCKADDLRKRKNDLSVHGHWSLGYYEGRLSVLEDLLDDILAEKEVRKDD